MAAEMGREDAKREGEGSCRPKFRIHVHALSRGKDLIKARREAPWSFLAQRPGPTTCPLYIRTHSSVRESGAGTGISSGLARVYAG